jgi:hypothetical protein
MSKAEIAELDIWMTNASKNAGPMAKDEAPHIEAVQ